ncbi:MAG TPA: alpha/beta fold hydrolase [Thermoanaerobaculia bacterium]|jgi:medium-chain acyl-[acyl-carrier-protein] hydrolase
MTTPWLRVLKSDPHARVRLFCFSYAGAGASAYRAWAAAPFERVELLAVQLPGRETRMREAPFTSVTPLVGTLARELAPFLHGKPFVFFGHSMGALLGYELTRELRRQEKPMPRALFVSGRRGPDTAPEPDDRLRHLMNDDDLIAEVRDMNGTDDGVMQHSELLELLLPIFRADFAVCENWRHEREQPLQIPIHALGGADDPGVSRAHLEAWARQTGGKYTLDMFEGGHFYVHDAREQLLARVGTYLRDYAI